MFLFCLHNGSTPNKVIPVHLYAHHLCAGCLRFAFCFVGFGLFAVLHQKTIWFVCCSMMHKFESIYQCNVYRSNARLSNIAASTKTLQTQDRNDRQDTALPRIVIVAEPLAYRTTHTYSIYSRYII